MEPFINETYKGLVILRALMMGLEVELEGYTYLFDTEVNKIGIKYYNTNEKKQMVSFPDIELNRFISICDQVLEDEFNKIVMAINFCDPSRSLKEPDSKEKDKISWN